MEKAFELFYYMEKAGLEPNVCTYIWSLDKRDCGRCRKGNMMEAWKLFKSMSESETHLKPNDVIYNMMIHGYCKEASSYRALRLLREMSENGMVPNAASYNFTIQVLCKDGKWKEAETLLNDMTQSGFKPSVSTYTLISEAKAVEK